MGKKKNNSNFGRTLIKDRFKGKKQHYGDTHLHTTELNDGYDWNRLNLQSVTEQNTLDDFLATAELAGTEFQAEKMNITVIQPEKHTGLLSKEEEKKVLQTQEEHKSLLRIPRRPSWNEKTSPEELDRDERDSFLEWRRELAQLQDVEGLILTPFERNLDFWRQLWRVIERSDIIVQIVDARNPLLFRCEDLEVYVKEIDKTKVNMLLINKADFLSETQRKYWAEYFNNLGVQICFWSAVLETERIQAKSDEDQESDNDMYYTSGSEESESEEESDPEDQLHDSENSETEEKKDFENEKNIDTEKDMDTTNTERIVETASDNNTCECTGGVTSEDDKQDIAISGNNFCNDCGAKVMDTETHHCQLKGHDNNEDSGGTLPMDLKSESSKRHTDTDATNNVDILTGDELIDFLKSLHTGEKFQTGVTTIGLVGYPNVGKSSTINAILQAKKVPVSATPGRTKHFQTLYVDETVMLCDCPGLVMPTFVSTKAEMIVSGILPIDQMRDYIPPVSLVSKYIPRHYLEATYGFMLPKPNIDEGDAPDKLPTAHQLLTAHACMRGFMTHKGVPDFQRSARIVLKDYVNGKLLYSHLPPTVSEVDFCPVGDVLKPAKQLKINEGDGIGANKPVSSMDKEFFSKPTSSIGMKGVSAPKDGSVHGSQSTIAGKPWKRHGNRNKKEKLRRKHKDLDVHTY